MRTTEKKWTAKQQKSAFMLYWVSDWERTVCVCWTTNATWSYFYVDYVRRAQPCCVCVYVRQCDDLHGTAKTTGENALQNEQKREDVPNRRKMLVGLFHHQLWWLAILCHFIFNSSSHSHSLVVVVVVAFERYWSLWIVPCRQACRQRCDGINGGRCYCLPVSCSIDSLPSPRQASLSLSVHTAYAVYTLQLSTALNNCRYYYIISY